MPTNYIVGKLGLMANFGRTTLLLNKDVTLKGFIRGCRSTDIYIYIYKSSKHIRVNSLVENHTRQPLVH